MRSLLLAAVGACLLALSIAGGAPRGTTSDFTATVSNTGNSFAAAADDPPVVAMAVIGKSTGGSVGYVKRSGTFYVYANATDDKGVASVSATITNVTGTTTVVTLTAGSYTADGVAYGYRSGLQTAASSGSGSKSFTVTATDTVGFTDTFSGTVNLDATAPTATKISTTNRTGGTDGRADQGDTAVITYSEAVELETILSGWDGTARNVQAAIVDGGGTNTDVLRVYATGAFNVGTFLPLGTIELGAADFITSGSYAVFGLTSANATPSTMTFSNKTLTITLGSLDSGTPTTSAANGTERYTPVATLTDLAGNAMTTTAVAATGTAHKAF